MSQELNYIEGKVKDSYYRVQLYLLQHYRCTTLAALVSRMRQDGYTFVQGADGYFHAILDMKEKSDENPPRSKAKS
jgi:hypothetical protein